jgi:hypothetical protein
MAQISGTKKDHHLDGPFLDNLEILDCNRATRSLLGSHSTKT